MTHGNQPGRGTGFDRNPGDSSSPQELSLAVLECGEDEAEAHLSALNTLVNSLAGTIHVTEVTGTCLALAIDAPNAAMPRLRAGLKLGGATIVPSTPAKGDRIAVILAVHRQKPKDRQ